MLTRILTIVVVAMLALPFAGATPLIRAGTPLPDEVTPPVQTILQGPPEAAPSLAAKKKKKKKKPKFKTVTRTVRQPVTQTFVNTALVTIPDSGTEGIAGLYPSAINVAGFANGLITDVNLTLHGYSHGFPYDVDVMLTATHLPNLNAIVLSDTCAGIAAGSNVTLDDQAAAPVPEVGPCGSGTFQPTNRSGGGPDTFDPPAPPPSGNSTLGVFNNTDPNGSWQLFVVDDAPGAIGQFAGGWTLQITAEADVQIQEQVKIKPKKKHKKK